MFDFGDLPEDEDEAPGSLEQGNEQAEDVSVFYPGDKVKAIFLKAQWYGATVVSDNGDGTYTLEWSDGDTKDQIKAFSEIKLVRRAKRPEAATHEAEIAAKQEAADRSEQQARERAEAELRAREERERAEKEAKELEESERKAREERERVEAERRAREEQERIEREAKEAEERAEAERKAKQEAEEKAEAERKAKEAADQAQQAQEKAEADRKTNGSSEHAESDGAVAAVSDPKQTDEKESAKREAEESAKAEQERREKAMQDQKKNAEYARREREKRNLVRAGGRVVGARVKIKDMKDKPHMNEACGTLVEEKGERWIVNLDGAPGVGKGKWIINRKNLVAAQWDCSEPKTEYSIVGSWNNWTPIDLTWDADRQCWLYTVTVGEKGWESFQFIVERNPNKCVHPDQKDATPHMPHKVCGPDFDGHGQNWSVGKHPLDKGRRGAEFEVRLFVWEDETPRLVEWSKPGEDAEKSAATDGAKRQRYSIAGTWNNWSARDMEWDEDKQHYYFIVQLSSQGWESFQILMEGDFKRCIHPSIDEANPYVAYTLCGPDSRGHGKNWTIGKHAQDKGSKGAKYKVRYFPAEGSRVGLVDWEPASQAATGNSTGKDGGASTQRKRFCITGTWGNWSPNDMSWDEKRKCYHYTVRLGLNGWESFQILLDGNYKKCIHPDSTDATPHEDHKLLGPDSDAHGKNWTIGRHRLDLGSRGSRFEVKLFVDEDGNPKSVDWERVATPGLGRD